MRILAEWRKRAGLTQAQLAERLGVSQVRISTLESGSHPSVELLSRIVDEMDPDAEELKKAIVKISAKAGERPEVGL